jgi:hypothetical protein
MSTSTHAPQALEAGLLRDLGLQMALLIHLGDGTLLQTPEIQRQLTRCQDPARRLELEQFVHRTEDELGRILREVDPPNVAAARRELAVSVHPVQFVSKLWLIDELAKRCELAECSLVVLGGWYGMLPLLVNLRAARPPRQMICIDRDARACDVGARMIGLIFSNVEYRCADVMDLDYGALGADHAPIVVNTICEHLADVAAWSARVPRGQLMALQSNNYEACADHLSCVQSLEQFKEQVSLSRLLYEGVLHLPELDRFMLIGNR